METTNGFTSYSFVRPAPVFEPPADGHCLCSTRNTARCSRSSENTVRSGSDRRRPFARSLGTHHGLARHDAARHDVDVPEDARRGAEQALRLLLEVLDHRRPAEKMGKLFAPNVVEAIKTIASTHPPGRRLGPASLRRVHIARSAPDAAEVFGTYARGPRVFAVAARLEYRATTRRSGWTITSLRVC